MSLSLPSMANLHPRVGHSLLRTRNREVIPPLRDHPHLLHMHGCGGLLSETDAYLCQCGHRLSIAIRPYLSALSAPSITSKYPSRIHYQAHPATFTVPNDIVLVDHRTTGHSSVTCRHKLVQRRLRVLGPISMQQVSRVKEPQMVVDPRVQPVPSSVAEYACTLTMWQFQERPGKPPLKVIKQSIKIKQ